MYVLNFFFRKQVIIQLFNTLLTVNARFWRRVIHFGNTLKKKKCPSQKSHLQNPEF